MLVEEYKISNWKLPHLISNPIGSNINGTSTVSVLLYPTSFSDIKARLTLPLSNNDTNTDVQIKENQEKYFALLSHNDTNNIGTVKWAELIIHGITKNQ